MTERSPSSDPAASTPADPAREASRPPSRDRSRGARMMVAGMVLAVLAPLFGFLAGSMIGPARQFGDFDAMFLSMFVGLLVGGVGAVVGGMGLLKFARDDSQEPWHF